nr:vacuolar protein sorting-associated protein 52 homolog [Pelodiscus sinensis]|eukprot:XP_025044217.1 vacuolar protein sorting-associated protein 52 homolog [Pelodiscus sinensis]
MTALGPDEELGLRAAEMEDEEGLGCGEEQSLQLNLGDLDLTSDEFILDEVDIHIQANLEDSLVQEALKTGVDLRQYSKQVELELRHIEHASIKDCILPPRSPGTGQGGPNVGEGPCTRQKTGPGLRAGMMEGRGVTSRIAVPMCAQPSCAHSHTS